MYQIQDYYLAKIKVYKNMHLTVKNLSEFKIFLNVQNYLPFYIKCI